MVVARINNNQDNEQYKQATQVVDDAMRTDQLGPSVVRVLEDHKPANDKVLQIMHAGIKDTSAIQAALGEFVKNDATMKKGKLVERAITIALAAVVTVVVGFFAKI